MASRILDLAYQQIRAQQEDSNSGGESGDGISLQFQNLELQEVPIDLVGVLNSQVLKLSFNRNFLRAVPPLPDLTRLFYLDLSENEFTRVPEAICELKSLEILDLSHNQISRLPQDLAKLQSLKVLSLSNNRLRHLPMVLTELEALEYIEVEDNPLMFPGPDILALAQEQDDWLPTLRQHLLENREAIEKIEASGDYGATQFKASPHIIAPQLERSRSSSEGYVNHRNKRMGFVMQRNTSGSSYMAGLHARGLSVDSSMVESLPDIHASALRLGTDWSSAADVPVSVYSGPSSRSDSGISLPSPRGSPLVTNPPRTDEDGGLRVDRPNSPSPAVDSVINRLSTLQEEDDDEYVEASESPPPPPKVPLKSQNRSRVNSSAAALDSVGASQPLAALSSTLSGYRKMQSSLIGFLQVVEAFELNGCPRYTACIGACRGALEGLDHALQSERDMAGASHRALTACIDLTAFLSTPAVLDQLVNDSRVELVRSLVMQLVRSFAELSNANGDLETPSPPPLPSGSQQASGVPGDLRDAQSSAKLALADEQLYLQLEHAVKTLQIVVSLFNTAIARSATASAEENDGIATGQTASSAGLAAYVGELSSACIDCVAMMRQLKQSLDHRGDRGIVDRRAFWEDVNSFLKSVVALLAAGKSAVVDLPLLADSGAEMSTLARVAKEIPPLLEQSSYRLHLDSNARLEHPKMPAMGSGPGTTTPFMAAIGADAQELLSPGLQTPFQESPV